MGQADRNPGAERGLDYQMDSYGFSRLSFRGPRQPLGGGQHIAFVGGTETFGKFLPQPFPALVEARTGVPCVNFGIVNAALGAHLGDSAVMAACHDAALTVIEVMGAHNLSNRFYRVHPRRNDRIVSAAPLLKEIYDEVDFADFVFTRHMLAALHAICPRRFGILRRELQRVWVKRVRDFAREMPVPPLLLWFAPAPPAHPGEGLGPEPLFVTPEMLEEVRPVTWGVLEVCPGAAIRAAGRDRMVHGPSEALAASLMLGPAAHEMVAEALAPFVASALDEARRA